MNNNLNGMPARMGFLNSNNAKKKKNKKTIDKTTTSSDEVSYNDIYIEEEDYNGNNNNNNNHIKTENNEIQHLVPLSTNGPENTSKYDLCLVFPLQDETGDLSRAAKEVLEHLLNTLGRKCIYQYNSIYGDRFVLIRGNSLMLKHKAEAMGFKVLLDPDAALVAAFDGDAVNNIARFEIHHDPLIVKTKPFEFIYTRFVADPDVQKIYARPNVASSSTPSSSSMVFKKTARIKLLMAIIQDSEKDGGAGMSLGGLRVDGTIRGVFPLHCEAEKSAFADRWLALCAAPWAQPFDEIKEYYGEKIGMYFHFLGAYVRFFFL